MQLPPHVSRLIEERADAIGFAALKRAAAALSEDYRARGAPRLTGEERTPRWSGPPLSGPPLTAEERTAAYLVTRMPATYAAAHAALREVRARLGNRVIESLLDVGAGTGAASLAAREWWGHAASVTMMERDAAFTAAARQWLPDTPVLTDDLMRVESLPPHDLVMAVYSVGELDRPANDQTIAARLWQAARVALVVIEPGWPRGYSVVLQIRDQLLAAGAYMVAPCPAATPCPLSGHDWCHFAARVERSSLHRRIKDAELGYEDEKFSYVALAREAVPLPAARVIRHPRHRPGLIELQTCTPAGVRAERMTKRDRPAFRAARQAGWGDAM